MSGVSLPCPHAARRRALAHRAVAHRRAYVPLVASFAAGVSLAGLRRLMGQGSRRSMRFAKLELERITPSHRPAHLLAILETRDAGGDNHSFREVPTVGSVWWFPYACISIHDQQIMPVNLSNP
jgi:hypothetical protein